MDKLSRKPTFKVPTSSVADGISTATATAVQPNIMGGLSKWVPLICAGSAIGISLFALKEIKNTRRELIALKKEQYTPPNNEKLEKKMEVLEKQLLKITQFISQQQQQRQPPPPPQSRQPQPRQPPPKSKQKPVSQPEIIKNVIDPEPAEVRIINEEPDEYEEVEVTDDETE